MLTRDVAKREKKSIKEYAQRTSMKGGSRGDQDSQEQRFQISSMEVCSVFSEQNVQLAQLW